MHFLIRVLQRILWFVLGASIVWFFVTRVFATLDTQLPIFFALVLSYSIPLYIILPFIIHVGMTLLRRGRIPRMTREADGLVADPVNLLFEGTAPELIHAFRNAGWHETDPLTIRTGWKMGVAFIFNRPYPKAPFSPLFLFGRKQDYGFELSIGNSPRKRHHVRFWAANVHPLTSLQNITYWFKKNDVDLMEPVTWVGAASRDIGFGLTPLTYRASHKTDSDVDDERDFVLEGLRRSGGVLETHFVAAGDLVAGEYVSDGKMAWAQLAPPLQTRKTVHSH